MDTTHLDDAVKTVPGQAFQPGDHCGQYEIRALIGYGGIGEVYRAEQRSIGREVAIKCLQFRHADRADLRARMEMEGRALGRISHTNMVTVFDAGCTEDGVVWIAMELLKGRTLREVLARQGSLPPMDTVECAIDIAEGVGAAHREKIIHRDIKPENVFITEQGAVKVLDLGTMKLQGWGTLKTTERGRVVGTPSYMSPEHIRSIRIDARSDIYALGVTIYEMLARHPFAHLMGPNDYQEMAKMHLFGVPRSLRELVPDVPKALDRAVQRSLAKDPDDRQQSMEELAADLRSAMGLPGPAIRMSLCPRFETVPPASVDAPPFGPHGTLKIDKPESAREKTSPAAITPPVTRAVKPHGQASITEKIDENEVRPSPPAATPPVTWAIKPHDGQHEASHPPNPDNPDARAASPLRASATRSRLPAWLLPGVAIGLVVGAVALLVDRRPRDEATATSVVPSAEPSVSTLASTPSATAPTVEVLPVPEPEASEIVAAPAPPSEPRPTAAARAPAREPEAVDTKAKDRPLVSDVDPFADESPPRPAPTQSCPGRLTCDPLPDPPTRGPKQGAGSPTRTMPVSGLE